MQEKKAATEPFRMLETLAEFADGASNVAIAGHVNPDGDCVGACIATYLYLRDNCPELTVDIYLEKIHDGFLFLEGTDQIKYTCDPSMVYDVLILLDISSSDRIGVAGPLFGNAKKTICFDHHATNAGGYDWFFNYPDASSTCEVVSNFLDANKVTKPIAEALFLGVVNDTGVFRYSSTSARTHQLAANLIQKGIDAARIIEEGFYQKTFVQQRILGRVLQESQLILEDRVIIGIVSKDMMDSFGAIPADMDGCVSQLHCTEGVEASVFIYETEPGKQKVSLRSRKIDVSRVAAALGGGGHMLAAGATVCGAAYDLLARVVSLLEEELAKLS